MARTIDLNADLGEGFGVWRLGDDDTLLALVSSANVACGFHAGDAPTMRRVCERAAALGVAVGAQVGYRDLSGFGRRRIDYELPVLRDEIIYQIAALDGFCRVAGALVAYVKPHGALYHAAAADPGPASSIVDAVVAYDAALPVLCQPGSVLFHAALEAGLHAVAEGFADRLYLPSGQLTPRATPGAVHADARLAAEQAVRLAVSGEVVCADATVLHARVESICLHGDTPGAGAVAAVVRDALISAGISVAPFASPRTHKRRS